jgi:hypothetical protein
MFSINKDNRNRLSESFQFEMLFLFTFQALNFSQDLKINIIIYSEEIFLSKFIKVLVIPLVKLHFLVKALIQKDMQ